VKYETFASIEETCEVAARGDEPGCVLRDLRLIEGKPLCAGVQHQNGAVLTQY